MTILNVRHITVYRYRSPVRLGDHRLMLRPRDSHDLRLIRTNLTFSPPASVRWVHDVFGNSVAIASFAESAAELRIESSLQLETYAVELPVPQIAPGATSYPFVYSADDRIDLGRMLERHHPDPYHWLGAWTQTPIETLDRGWGSCRDLAMLFIEAARSLGLGARVVTGYLHNPSGGSRSMGAGSTHAWADIYVPGAGWIAYDPTNGTIGGNNLIRVAVTRDIGQAVPVAGSFVGAPDDYLGMTVEVLVAREG
jgi:transglutaminase-like putative cysteine protease